ncbi:uncharacterized protein LOC127002825 isoform X2 [Eriocheir sinensis]|uniref:uncharacterized protein LOC127002825 isoform X2 n=1 Tax=Eriocheir sinensis TaxID=95602 RepID=UPI0021C79585|nr:uncharacterized protein LOC127002825 isoform X2 [Eriocheir sinensis]
MASPNGRREGEEKGKAEAEAGDAKPSQMDLFAAMLASMRQELDQRADEQARHLAEVLQSCFSSLKVETQQYTDQGCDSARSERLEEVRTQEGEVRGLMEAERWHRRTRRKKAQFWQEAPGRRSCRGLSGAPGKDSWSLVASWRNQ